MENLREEIISHVVTKCSKSSLSWTLKQWGRFPDINIDDLISKRGSSSKAKLAKKISALSEVTVHLTNLKHINIVYFLSKSYLTSINHSKTFF